ncbi:hypothetical protein [Bacteroides congonensis]
MKIAKVTQPLLSNYGGIFQNYALLLNHFSVVSIREESGVDLCSKYLKYKSA